MSGAGYDSDESLILENDQGVQEVHLLAEATASAVRDRAASSGLLEAVTLLLASAQVRVITAAKSIASSLFFDVGTL